MKTAFKTRGTCAQLIEIETEDGIVKDVKFHGGCSGNAQGVAALCVGRGIDEVAATLKGIRCGFKSTSCPDQLAIALEQISRDA